MLGSSKAGYFGLIAIILSPPPTTKIYLLYFTLPVNGFIFDVIVANAALYFDKEKMNLVLSFREGGAVYSWPQY